MNYPETLAWLYAQLPMYQRVGAAGFKKGLGNTLALAEALAFARPAEALALYHVSFDRQAIWPDSEPGELLVEIFEPWLEPT